MDVHNTHDNAQEIWLTVSEAAERLPAVSIRSVQAWAKKGRFPNAIRLPSGHWRIPLEDVQAIVDGSAQ
ncbi:helix-turn-helix domain-containing protein [Corynebacterium diphtheriae]